LSKEDISKIVNLELMKTINRSKEIGYELEVDDTLLQHLITVGYDAEYGARPLKRAIQKWVDDFVTEYIIDNNLKTGQKLNLSYDSVSDITIIKDVTKKGRTKKK
jgi:ATP-dependent Clp protease ATP-binding subunit ClpC